MDISYIKIRKNKEIYCVSNNNIFLKPQTQCITETPHGIDIGFILKSCIKRCRPDEEVKGKIIRIASEEDTKKIPELEEIEKKAFDLCKSKSIEKKLDMKLINVKCLFDKTKIIFYFVAENRVDFRELVRDLAAVFRTRIEMRQIGVRDESRMVGGYGPCGRPLCCTRFRGYFAPVSIKMAKEQNLNLNSLKISGICGRLLCCLDYEHEVYKELNANLPQTGSKIHVGEESFFVDSIDSIKQTIQLSYIDHRISVHRDDLKLENGKYTLSQQVIDRIEHHDHEEFDFKF